MRVNHLEEDIFWKVVFSLSIISFILFFCNEIFAGTATSNDAIGDTLCRVVQNLQGNIARAVATIGIFVVGVGLFMGKLNWATALATAVGIGIVFGAGRIVVWIGGTEAGACE